MKWALRAVADRVIFMDGGRIIEEGRPEDILTSQKKNVLSNS